MTTDLLPPWLAPRQYDQTPAPVTRATSPHRRAPGRAPATYIATMPVVDTWGPALPTSPALEAWLEDRHDPAWKPHPLTRRRRAAATRPGRLTRLTDAAFLGLLREHGGRVG